MRYQDYLDLAAAPTLTAFQAGLERFAGEFGFGLVSAALVVPRPGNTDGFYSITNAPQAYQALFADQSASRRDPVLSHLKTSSVPIVYDRGTYRSKDADDLWEEQAPFGYHTGVSVALHLPNLTHFLLGMDRPDPLSTDDSTLTRLFADLQLLAVHAQHAATALLQPAASQRAPTFTPRELECLKWTAAGKTAWEIGQILSISEPTVQFHLRNATAKVGATSKHQAVLAAVKWSLL